MSEIKTNIRYSYRPTYGYFLNADGQPYMDRKIVQKVTCDDEKAEIYKIGIGINETHYSETVYVLVWEHRVIPFKVVGTYQTSSLKLSHTLPYASYVSWQYEIPIKSALVMDIGVTLADKGRRVSSYSYHGSFLNNRNQIEYYFESDTEYQKCLELIHDGLVLLFFDNYTYNSYDPSILAHIDFFPTPWNMSDGYAGKSYSFFESAGETEYRRACNVYRYVERVKSEHKIQSPFTINKAHDFVRKHMVRQHILERLKTNDKPHLEHCDDFINFVINPIDNKGWRAPRMVMQMVQDECDKQLFAKEIIEDNHPAYLEFMAYKQKLDKEYQRRAEDLLNILNKNLSPVNALTPAPWHEEYDSQGATLEDVMMRLLSYEKHYHYINDKIHGSGFHLQSLKCDKFINVIKDIYNHSYSSLSDSSEILLINLIEIIMRRTCFRSSKEESEKLWDKS